MIRQEKVIPSVISIHKKWCIACHFHNVTAKKLQKKKKSQIVISGLSSLYLVIHFLQESRSPREVPFSEFSNMRIKQEWCLVHVHSD